MAGRSDIMAGKAFVELSLKNSMTGGIKAAGQQLRNFGGTISMIGATITAAGAGMKAFFGAALMKFAESGDKIDKMSRRTGIGANALSELGFAAEQSGKDLETLEGSLKKMQKSVGSAISGDAGAIDDLRGIGVAVSDLKGQAPERQFEIIADGISKIEDPTQRAAAAMKIFGKSGTDMLPLMEDGAAGIQALRKEARDLGLSKSPESAKLAADLTDAFNRVRRVIGSIVSAIGSALAPKMLDMLGIVQNVLVAVGKWVRDNKGLFATMSMIATVLVAVGSAITTLGIGFMLAGTVVSGFGSALGVVMGLMGALLSPVVLVGAAIAAAVGYWAMFTESGQNAVNGLLGLMNDLLSTAKQTFGGILDAVRAGDFSLAGEIAMTGLKVAMLQGVKAISSLVGGAFGDFLGTIGSQIAGGDMKGAWDTAVKAMAKVWADFSAGVVSVFTSIAKPILGVWEKITTWIANRLLELDSLLGGTMAKEQEKADRIRAVNLARAQRQLQEDTDAQKAGTDTTGRDRSQEQIAKDIAQHQADISRYSTPEDLVANAQSATGDTISDMKAAADKWMEALNQQSQQNQNTADNALGNATAGGTGKADAALAQAQKDLEFVRAKAGYEAWMKELDDMIAEDEKKGGKAGTGGQGDINGKVQQNAFATFSAAAAKAQVGASNDPVVNAAKEQMKQRALLAKQKEMADQRRHDEAMRAGVFTA